MALVERGRTEFLSSMKSPAGCLPRRRWGFPAKSGSLAIFITLRTFFQAASGAFSASFLGRRFAADLVAQQFGAPVRTSLVDRSSIMWTGIRIVRAWSDDRKALLSDLTDLPP